MNRGGGTQRITSVIANELSKNGYKVHILSIKNGESPFYDLESSIEISSLHLEGKSSNFSSVLTIKRLRKYLKLNYIELIIDVDIILSFFSIPATVGMSTEVISWEHFHYFINTGGIIQRAKRRIGRLLAARFSKYIVTLTEKDRQQYKRHMRLDRRLIAINNPITIDHKDRADLQTKTVLAIGRLAHQKGFDQLLRSWQKVTKECPDWTLRIVGSGPDEEQLKKLSYRLAIAETLEFVPESKNIERHFLEASIFVMSSRFEGFPLVLLEAKSFGLPIVSFDCKCGPSDIVIDRVDGILVEEGNVSSLADEIVGLIRNETKRACLGSAAFGDKRFSIENIMPLWRQILS